MVQESLVEYVRRLLQQGYDQGTIRTTLLNAGYSPYDVDTAMRLAGEAPKRVGTKLLIVVFVVLLVVAGGVLIILKLLQPPIELSMSLSLFSTVRSPGQDLVLTAQVLNPSGRETSALLDVVVYGPEGKVASRTESVVVEQATSVPLTFSLPSTLVSGDYTVQAKLSYEGPSVSDTVSFEVSPIPVEVPLPVETLEEREEVRARELQLTCPGGCDDLNFCTTDDCVAGKCVHTPIVPCCGNKVCESGEDVKSCALDCGERPVGPDEIRERASALASSDLAAAIDLCDTLAQRQYIDGCLKTVSKEVKSQAPCESIVDDDMRDACFIPFAYSKDFSVCPKITNPFMKNSCLSLKQLSEAAT